MRKKEKKNRTGILQMINRISNIVISDVIFDYFNRNAIKKNCNELS